MKAYYPFIGHHHDIGGLKLHYLDEGKGDPVVMIHGNPTWSFYYRSLVEALRGSYRVIVLDHIGCGLSDKPGRQTYPYTLSRRVDDLENLLALCGAEKDLTLVVHDWGGMIGMTYAVRHPEAVKRFVVLNTSAFRLPAGRPFPWMLALIRNTPLGAFLVQGLNAFCLGALAFCAKEKKLSREEKEAYLAPYDTWEHRIAVLRFVQDIPLRPGDDSYDTVVSTEEHLGLFRDHPMLILWGMGDFVFDGHFLEGWAQRFPKALVHRFPGAGHYVLEDRGIEIAALVKEFLAANPLKR
ncbi:MAG: alpha/beta fold hydrolase [Candidatus Eremiobacteraeota bacterium]|nr:alpha/beta fold hydrolase [Candidatus Eremiobacteraeota bacterium]